MGGVQRKRVVTGVSSSRWAGAITRAAEDQYQLGLRALSAHATDLHHAIDMLEAGAPCAPESKSPAHDAGLAVGYRSPHERFTKTRRLATLRERLPAPRTRYRLGGRRSPWAGNVCGAP